MSESLERMSESMGRSYVWKFGRKYSYKIMFWDILSNRAVKHYINAVTYCICVSESIILEAAIASTSKFLKRVTVVNMMHNIYS